MTVPERIGLSDRGYFGCPRCQRAATRKALDDAPAVFSSNGLRLSGRCRGEYVPQVAECLACGTLRRVSLSALREGSAPLCWSCTHGIRPDEPHRVYLVHFPKLRAMKVGLTHCRHDRRLVDHELFEGVVLSTATVKDRKAAREVEAEVLRRYAGWSVPGITSADFPQGGWTETWSDDAPSLDLPALVAAIADEALIGAAGR